MCSTHKKVKKSRIVFSVLILSTYSVAHNITPLEKNCRPNLEATTLKILSITKKVIVAVELIEDWFVCG